MKKILLSIVAVIALTASSVFGYYKADNFIDFLVHKNQMRIRLDRLGFNTSIADSGVQLAVGFTGAPADVLINNLATGTKDKGLNSFLPAALIGVGYKATDNLFGVGVGYQFKWLRDTYQVHTPVVTATAMNNAFRINVPVFIGVGSGKNDSEDKDRMAISIAPEVRYYTGLRAFSHFRLYVRYGEDNSKIGEDKLKYSSVGFQLRLYFGAMAGDVLIEPIIRIQYDQALKTTSGKDKGPGQNFDITAEGNNNGTGVDGMPSDLKGGYLPTQVKGVYIEDPYRFGIALPVGFTANSDIVSLYLEPALSLTMLGGKDMYVNANNADPDYWINRKDAFYTFGYVVYGEIYIRPLPALEWYFEAQTGGATVANGIAGPAGTSLVFNASTGITWYF